MERSFSDHFALRKMAHITFHCAPVRILKLVVFYEKEIQLRGKLCTPFFHLWRSCAFTFANLYPAFFINAAKDDCSESFCLRGYISYVFNCCVQAILPTTSFANNTKSCFD